MHMQYLYHIPTCIVFHNYDILYGYYVKKLEYLAIMLATDFL